jgi:hypothetical protein
MIIVFLINLIVLQYTLHGHDPKPEWVSGS